MLYVKADIAIYQLLSAFITGNVSDNGVQLYYKGICIWIDIKDFCEIVFGGHNA